MVGGSYSHKILPFDAQETINMYPEMGDAGSNSQSILLRFPGLLLFKSLTNGEGAIRGKGIYESSNHRLFVIRGSKLVELSALGVETLRGTLTTISGPVSMVDNGTDLAIADGLIFINLFYLPMY